MTDETKPSVVEEPPTTLCIKRNLEDLYDLLSENLKEASKEYKNRYKADGWCFEPTREEELKAEYEERWLGKVVDDIRAQMAIIEVIYKPFADFEKWQAWKKNDDAVKSMMGEWKMATKLEFDKSITREIQIRALPGPVNVTIDNEGVTIAVPGCRKKVTIDWDSLIDRCQTPADVPAKFYQRPRELLLSQMKD